MFKPIYNCLELNPFILRLELTSSDSTLRLKCNKTQFLLLLAFAITIISLWIRQSLKYELLYLFKQFSFGQLYVIQPRIKCFIVLIETEPDDSKIKTLNTVYNEILE